MDYGILINAVEGQNCLYDKTNKNYKNNIVKEAAWAEIAEITSMSKEECKKRWNLLRERFNKEQKKRDLPSGSGASCEEEWPYNQSMMFLKKFIQPRKTKSNHFEDEESLSENFEVETPPPKRGRVDPFTDTCNVFKEAIEEFRSTMRNTQPQPTRAVDADEHFLESVKEYIKDLPENVKGQARIDILTYVQEIRNKHLGI